MLFITFFRNNARFLNVFTLLAVCLLTAVGGFAQTSQKFTFHSLEEQTADINALDPLFNLRKTDPQQFKNLAKTSAENLKTISENLTPSAGELDPSFNPSIDLIAGSVRASAVQTDGKLVAAGYFKTVNGSRHDNIIRFNTDNTIDETFSASTNGTILRSGNSGGRKNRHRRSFHDGQRHESKHSGKAQRDGSLDNSFDAGTGADNLIYDIAVQPDGKILLGGNFIGINNYFSPAIVRLNADGSADTTFASPLTPPQPGIFPSIAYSIALQADGKIALGGAFVTNPSSPAFKSIIRLNSDGSFDNSFDAGSINSNLYKVVIQPDGKFIIGGFFQTINGVSRPYIARLKSDGSLDESFDAGTSITSPVTSLYIKPDSKILVGGLRSTNGLAKQLNSDGTLDIVLNANTFGSFVNTIALTGGGKIFIGGELTFSFGSLSNAAFLFNSDGSQDSSFSFSPTAASSVSAIAVQPDGKILLGGTFDRVNGVNRNRILRLNPDGTTDTSFILGNGSGTTFLSSGFQVTTINLQPDGKILVGGAQISAGNLLSASLVRLNPDGSYDNSFTLADSLRTKTATAVALRSDGKILFAYTGRNTSGQVEGGVSRLNSDGSIETAFNFGFTPVIKTMVPLPDGKVLAGGPFYFGFVVSESGQNDINYGLVRFNEDGTVDSTFHAAFTLNEGGFTIVNSVAVQPDGQILVGGRLFIGSSITPYGVVRLNQSGTIDGTFSLNPISSTTDLAQVEKIRRLANGKILAAGRFNNFAGAPNANVARLNANGSIDTAFQTNTDKSVLDVAQQSDGKVLIGGTFDVVNNAPRSYFARLLSEPVAPRRARFDFDGDGKSDISVFRPSDAVWYLNNSSAGFTAVNWGLATDKLVPADYDGDGKTDVAVYRDGVWYLLRSTERICLCPVRTCRRYSAAG